MNTNVNTGGGGLGQHFNMSLVLYVFAGVILAVGVVMCVAFWPAKVVFGYEWSPVAYLPSAGALTFGILQGAVLAALGKGLSTLGKIARNTSK